jgi:hypothetical protein
MSDEKKTAEEIVKKEARKKHTHKKSDQKKLQPTQQTTDNRKRGKNLQKFLV